MIIAIDGPAGTGKSTVAKGVAKRLGFTFFDTGAMYRSFSWLVIEEGVDAGNKEKVCELLPQFQYEIKTDEKGERHYFVGQTDVTSFIRTQQISSTASQIAIYPEVRSAMVQIQRKFGHAVDAVFEGRDMGTVVFPDADLKIFLTARPEVRAQRRHRELAQKGMDVSFEEVLKETVERDKTDSSRKISPLKQAPDAILIDTSDVSADQVIEKIIHNVKPLYMKNMKLSYKIVYSLARFFFKVFFRLKIYGLEHFKPGPAIIAANHASLYDPPVLSISCPEEVHFLAKASLFDIPILGHLIRTLNSHPVAKGASDVQTFRMLLELLEEGKKVIVFPEGQRSSDGELLPFQRGLAFLVQKAKVPIIPAYISGSFEVWPRGKKFPKIFGKMAVVFGPPIEWSEFESMDKKEAVAQITIRAENAVRKLRPR